MLSKNNVSLLSCKQTTQKYGFLNVSEIKATSSLSIYLTTEVQVKSGSLFPGMPIPNHPFSNFTWLV